MIKTMEKETFDRLVIEFKDLSEKTEKLRDFLINKVKDAQIDNLNKDLLICQLKAMETYQGILSIRIGLNNKFADNSEENNVEEVSE